MTSHRCPSAWRALLLSALLALAGAAGAEPKKNVRFERISLEHGLSQAVVTCALQDRRGFMWFGTQEGLNRFDGYEFTLFVHDAADPTSLSHDIIKSLLVDREGTLWVGTDGGGLNRFDEATGTFTRYRHDSADPRSLSNDRVRTLLESRSGELWIGTDGGGLGRLDRKSGAFEPLSAAAEAKDLAVAKVRDLIEDRQGRLWVATEGDGLYRVDPEGGEVARFRHDPQDASSLADDRVRTIFEDRDGVVWAGTYGGGLVRFDPEHGGFDRFAHDPEDPRSLGTNGVWTLFQDRQGELWIGTDGGLHRFRPDSGTFDRYRHDPADLTSLSHDRVVSLYQDRGGVLWVGTYGGLNKWNPITQHFVHYQHLQDDPDQLNNNFVTSFAETEDGVVWVGTFGGGLNRLDRESGTFRHFRHDPDNPHSLSDDRVMALYVDPQGTLWIGTFGGGLNRLDRTTGRFTHYRHDPDDPASLSRDGVTDMLQAADGSFWVGTYGGGLNRLDRATGRFTRFPADPTVPGRLASDRVVKLFQDRSDTLWLGTDGGGLNRYDPASGRFTALRHDPADPASLGNDVAWAMHEDDAGNLWIATQGGGLSLWAAEDRRQGRQRFRRFTKSDGLPSDVVYGIVPDDRGRFWLSSNRGLTVFDPEEETFQHFDVTHGLQSNEFNYRAEMRARDGQLFFGGVRGFNAFYPDRLARNDHAPPVVITRVLKFNQPILFDRPLAEVEEVELGHQDYVLAFEFAALDFAAPAHNRYLHRLEGFDSEWVESTSLRRATYTNLAPGSYTFRVRAANNDGVWSEQDAVLRVLALPPPWRTPWAYVGYALLAGGIVLLFVRSQARKQRHAEELARTNRNLVEEINRREAKELALEHEKRKAQRYLDVVEVIMLVLSPDGEVTLINQKGCRVLGCKEGEILGKRWVETFVPEAQRQEVRRLLRSPEPQGYCEYSILNADGEERIIAWHTTVLTTDDGTQAGTLSSGSDITQIHQLTEAKESAESASRAKSQFLANMSHEIRTPMNGLLGMIELLLGSELSGRQRNFAKTARRSAMHLLDILNDILDFSKIEAGKLELEVVDFHLRELVEDVVALFAERAHQKGLELLCDVPAEVPDDLAGDPTRLRQILSNLLGNAIKFTERGEVAISLADLGTTGDGSRIRFSVRDTGIGLAPDARESIFDSFHQGDGSTTRKYGGTGLGLAISRELVEVMGGQLGVDSEVGRGSTFWFEVTLGESEQRHDGARLRPFDGDFPRLLVVDDNASFRKLLLDQLARWGLSAEGAAHGLEALGLLRAAAETDDPFGLVIVDQAMPTMGGLELALARTDDPHLRQIPVVLLITGELPDERALRSADIHTSLAKPVRQRELYDCIASLTTPAFEPADAAGLETVRKRLPSRARILLAEDNLVNQELVQCMLESMGGTVEVVRDGYGAVEAVTGGPFDLVLMDCQMPGMDGYSATREIRRWETAARHSGNGNGHRPRPRMPIVAMTANAMAGDQEKCLAAGMDDYLSKPFSQDELCSRVLRWLAPEPAEARPGAPGEAAREGEEPDGRVPTLDAAVLDGIRDLEAQGSTGLLERMARLYLESSPELLGTLRQAVARRHASELRNAAHSLRSSSANLGAGELAALCRELESMARQDETTGTRELVAAIELEFDRVRAALEVECGRAIC